MKYGQLKKLTAGLLNGDKSLPKDDEETQGLLMLAYNDIASRAESLHLMTLNQNQDILRTATGDYLMRFPNMPEDDNSDLDIDRELAFVAARLVASYVSKNKPGIHASEAEKMIMIYNSKVSSLLESLKIDSEGTGYVD